MKSNNAGPISMEEHARLLSKGILSEILYAFSGKRSGLLQRLATPLVRIPAVFFGKIAADFYDQVNHLGISRGAQVALQRFNHRVEVREGSKIQPSKPLLLVSNHPGGLDSLGIVSCIPRNDLKALVTDVKFLRQFDYLSRYFIFVDFKTTGGMLALREAIIHLQSGGALLLFAHGEVEPEPECFPGASDEIGNWSPSLEIMLRKVPGLQLQILTVSGSVQSRYLRNPLTLLRKEAARRQKLAEFLQVIHTMLFRNAPSVTMHLTIGQPVSYNKPGDSRWMPGIIQLAKQQMADHLRWVKTISTKA